MSNEFAREAGALPGAAGARLSPVAERPCPACARPTTDALLAKARDLDALVSKRIALDAPAWRPEDGVCPACVQEAFQTLLRADAAFSLDASRAGVPESEMPEYFDDLFVLSTPMRIQTWPQATGEGVTIAFVDAGFFDHPDLTQPVDRVVARVDARFDPPRTLEANVAVDPACFHGLMTTTVAAGNGAFSRGYYRGIAPNARLVLVRVGDPETGEIAEEQIARGLAWLVANHVRVGVRVVNVSLGGDYPAPSDENLVDALVERLVSEGVTVVAASGNEGKREIVPPASAPSAITVGGFDDNNSVDRDLAEAWNSNFGPTADGILKPEIVAPSIWVAAPMILGSELHERSAAVFRLLAASDDELADLAPELAETLGLDEDVLTSGPTGIRSAISRLRREMKLLADGYQHVEGTSFAAPIVTGIVAQMLEANPALTPAEIKAILTHTARPLERVPGVVQGAGVVEPALALDGARRAGAGALLTPPASPVLEDGAVVFRLREPGARRVAVVGDFNEWRDGATPLARVDAGDAQWWEARIPVPDEPGARYKFLVDGERWTDDPENPRREWDGYGGLNSVLRL